MSEEDVVEEAPAEVHPALKSHSRAVSMTTHVVKKALKYGAIAAAVAGVSLLILSLPVAAPLGAVAGLVQAVTGWNVAAAGGAALYSMVTTAAVTMGTAGAAIGAMIGLSGAQDAANAEEERLVENFERGEARVEKARIMEMQQQKQMLAMARQSQQLGIAPGHGLGRMGRSGAADQGLGAV